MNKGSKLIFAAMISLAGSVGTLYAEEEGGELGFVPLVEGKPFIHVVHNGSSVKVQRVQDVNYELSGYYAKTVRKCPPFCIQPMHAAPGVETVAEVEIFDFMENGLRSGTGLLIDARTPSWHEKGTIPGSVNIPFTELTKDPGTAEMNAQLEKLGAKKRGDVGFFTELLEKWGLVDSKWKTKDWDFSQAKDLILWCNGPSCGQSPRAIHGLIAAGYPADKLKYYRGGMQLWQLWGLTTVVPSGAVSKEVQK